MITGDAKAVSAEKFCLLRLTISFLPRINDSVDCELCCLALEGGGRNS